MIAVVFGGYFLALPMHASGALVVDLHAIHSDIAFAGFGIAGDDAGEGDETSSVLRPALQDWEIEEGEIITFDDFFARAGGNGFGKEFAHLGEHGEHFDFVEKALGRFDIHEGADAIGDLIEIIDIEREAHTEGGSELVDQELGAGITFQVFEEESFAANGAVFTCALGNAVGNFRDFEDRVGFAADALEFAGTIECFDPVA